MSAISGVESVPGRQSRGRASVRTWLHSRGATLMHWLPQGQLLPEHVWRRRHAGIVLLLWLHVPALFAFGMLIGHHSLAHVAADVGLIVLCAVGSSAEPFGVKARIVAASVGLMTCSAVLVDLWDGRTEAHFHFFVMIGVLTLYQDWTPFLVAIGYVVVHHGLGGVLSPDSVYSNPQAQRHPWVWALIHGGFVLAASAVHIVAWRTNENQLLRDPLTGLPSRVLYLNNLKVALQRLDRAPGQNAAVMFLDLDRFKVINDSLGHGAGDDLLIAVAERVGRCLRRHETLARFGGDEFVILCEDIGDEQSAIAVAERVLKTFSSPFTLAHGETTAAVSIGVALGSDVAQDPEDLIRDADAAMYRAKASGGSRVVLFDELTRERALARLHTENALRKAIEREEFRLFFQPEVSIGGDRIEGVEALIRWEHPERGLLGPGEFIPLAEETGLIVPIGTWVLREACRQAVAWEQARVGGQPLVLRVNVSARQLAESDVAATVERILAETGMNAMQLCLEVTESVLIEDPESSIRVLSALKTLGLQIAVDDFGTGYSSLEYLRRLPVDCVKIDRSFVSGLPESAEDAAIVAAVIELGHTLKLAVTAEGVETVEQLGNLQRAGCDTAQGFLFSRPQPADVLTPSLVGSVSEVASLAGAWQPTIAYKSRTRTELLRRQRLAAIALRAGLRAGVQAWTSGN